jgi:hypothetical protein
LGTAFADHASQKAQMVNRLDPQRTRVTGRDSPSQGIQTVAPGKVKARQHQ